ncbi:hypothetical protein AYO44_07825 [Planctomycetaceae bacterium SCGC AG-212-F19]|nr:hypothetical protein AYO44_07825 [Planctomycetaceae bacterium SCGC AG-212-F19]
MTTMGKVLVFINFLFSVLTGALIIMVFITRTNWAKGFDEVKRDLERERNNFLSEREQKYALEKAKTEEDNQKDGKIKEQGELLKIRDAEKADLSKQRDEAKGRELESALALNKATAVAEAMKVENKSLEEQNKEKAEHIIKLGLQNKEYKQEAIKARTDLQSAIDRNQQLLAKLVESDRKLAALQGDRAAQAGREAVNPPPDDIYGRVTEVNEGTGWVKINLGSDSGIVKNNTLEVYRLQPRPAYVGTLRIYEVRPNEAIGKLMGAGPRGRIQKDDEVASRILGGP